MSHTKARRKRSREPHHRHTASRFPGPDEPHYIRALWLAITVLAASMVGTSAGVLSWLGGMNSPNAILAGGGAFAGTVILGLTVIHFLTYTKQ